MAYRPHPKRARTDIDYPQAWGTDDRSGFVGNLNDFRWQMQWSGSQLINLRILVHPDHLDIPQEQLRTLVIPPDPDPLFNARPEPYAIDEENFRTTNSGQLRVTNNGNDRVANNSTNYSYAT